MLITARYSIKFQSTSPVRGTTSALRNGNLHGQISIHVPREGDDRIASGALLEKINFNPRPP